MFKKILIAVAVVIVGFVVVVAMQPAEYTVTRSTTVAAPAAAVFTQVNDLHNWKNWSPWAKLDPAMKETFEGAPAGKGAISSWAGNDEVGEGRMTVVDSRSPELSASSWNSSSPSFPPAPPNSISSRKGTEPTSPGR